MMYEEMSFSERLAVWAKENFLRESSWAPDYQSCACHLIRQGASHMATGRRENPMAVSVHRAFCEVGPNGERDTRLWRLDHETMFRRMRMKTALVWFNYGAYNKEKLCFLSELSERFSLKLWTADESESIYGHGTTPYMLTAGMWVEKPPSATTIRGIVNR